MTDIFDKNTAVWFEIPATDFSRAVSFYEQVFKVKLNPEEMGAYRMGVFPHAGEAISGIDRTFVDESGKTLADFLAYMEREG